MQTMLVTPPTQTYATELVDDLVAETKAQNLHWRSIFFGKKFVALNPVTRHCSYVIDDDGLHIADTSGKIIPSLGVGLDQEDVKPQLEDLMQLVRDASQPWNPPATTP